jgi:predicted porin
LSISRIVVKERQYPVGLPLILRQVIFLSGQFWLNSSNFQFRRLVRGVTPNLFFSTLEKFSMKKTLIALAAVAVSSAAMAQVTVSGTYSASYQKDLTSQTRSSAGALTPSKGLAVTDATFTMRAAEDLGNGLKAAADMGFETAFNRGDTLTRIDSGVSLSGGFGTVAFRNTRNGDLLAGAMSGAVSVPDSLYDSTGILARSEIETLAYTSPELIKGLRASLTYVEPNSMAGNKEEAATNNQSYVVGVNYADGPVAVAVSYKTKSGDAAASTGLTSKNNVEASVAYDFGVARIAYAYDGASVEGASTAALVTGSATATALTAAEAQEIANLATEAAHGISLTVPMGAITLGVNYAKRDTAKYVAYGATYAFSKRTSLSVAGGKKSGLTLGEATGHTGTQYRVRLGHSF